ncbi:MAG TPA: hypothetical protein VMS29_07815, partial [Pyrinomonadaceae bacterium]|nr:hypothetical protein [Pyrinomonadaceae bacterium]
TLVGAVWLVVIAIQTGQTNGEKVIWALVNFLCQPLGGIVFYIVKKEGLIPLIFVLIGSLLLGFGNYSLMMDMMNQMPR